MFVVDVKCSQATWQTIPNSRAGVARRQCKACLQRRCAYVAPRQLVKFFYRIDWCPIVSVTVKIAVSET